MRFSTAIGASLAAHAVLAAALLAYLKYVPSPTVSVELDLSSVELSFAEKTDESAPLADAPLARPEPPAPRPDLPPPKPELERPDDPPPPDPAAARIPEPEPERPEMETPPPPAPPPVASAPKQARIDAPPKPRRTIRPDYPRAARERGEQGDVVVEIRVNAQGTVDDVSVVSSSGFAALDIAAVEAARAARFTPAKSGRESVSATARLTLSFKLH